MGAGKWQRTLETSSKSGLGKGPTEPSAARLGSRTGLRGSYAPTTSPSTEWTESYPIGTPSFKEGVRDESSRTFSDLCAAGST